MRNHFRLVVQTPKANLVPGMKWLFGTYTCGEPPCLSAQTREPYLPWDT
jgi:hypothetical protein